MSQDLGELNDPLTQMSVMLYYHIQDQIQLADNKAQFILAANAILAAGATTIYRGMAVQILSNRVCISIKITSLLFILMFIALVCSFCYALSVARPRMKIPLKNESNLYYFGGIQLYNAEEFAEKFNAITYPQMRNGVLTQVYVLSHIAFMKFLRVKTSINYLLIAIFLWGLGHFFMGFAHRL